MVQRCWWCVVMTGAQLAAAQPSLTRASLLCIPPPAPRPGQSCTPQHLAAPALGNLVFSSYNFIELLQFHISRISLQFQVIFSITQRKFGPPCLKQKEMFMVMEAAKLSWLGLLFILAHYHSPSKLEYWNWSLTPDILLAAAAEWDVEWSRLRARGDDTLMDVTVPRPQ